jgi:hypothetical protein
MIRAVRSALSFNSGKSFERCMLHACVGAKKPPVFGSKNHMSVRIILYMEAIRQRPMTTQQFKFIEWNYNDKCQRNVLLKSRKRNSWFSEWNGSARLWASDKWHPLLSCQMKKPQVWLMKPQAQRKETFRLLVCHIWIRRARLLLPTLWTLQMNKIRAI